MMTEKDEQEAVVAVLDQLRTVDAGALIAAVRIAVNSGNLKRHNLSAIRRELVAVAPAVEAVAASAQDVRSMDWVESIRRQALAYRREDIDQSEWSIYNRGRADALDAAMEDVPRMLSTRAGQRRGAADSRIQTRREPAVRCTRWVGAAVNEDENHTNKMR